MNLSCSIQSAFRLVSRPSIDCAAKADLFSVKCAVAVPQMKNSRLLLLMTSSSRDHRCMKLRNEAFFRLHACQSLGKGEMFLKSAVDNLNMITYDIFRI